MAEGWGAADRFVQHIHDVIEEQPARDSYYPGSEDRRLAVAGHPSAVSVGRSSVSHVRDLDPGETHRAFEEEFFSAAFASTRLPYSDPGCVPRCRRRLRQRAAGRDPGSGGHRPSPNDGRARPPIREVDRQACAMERWGSMSGLHSISCNREAVGVPIPATPWQTWEAGSATFTTPCCSMRPRRPSPAGPFRPLGRSLLAGEFHISPKPPWFVTSRTGRRTVGVVHPVPDRSLGPKAARNLRVGPTKLGVECRVPSAECQVRLRADARETCDV